MGTPKLYRVSDYFDILAKSEQDAKDEISIDFVPTDITELRKVAS